MPAATGPENSPGNTPEVFLGPTGSETEEFYAYQRQNPGLEKTQYLDWFQSRFNKEIELRRRRSDQPSDLEYMVIKKRSKYRERIGEESSELVAYSEENPSKTYRELAEWFQNRFSKEIDITAISRALKRSRQDVEPPNPDVAPAAKRGRRSLNANPNAANNACPGTPGTVAGSIPTFAVDIKGRPGGYGSSTHTPIHTPNHTPGHTPKNGHAILPLDYEEDQKPNIASLAQSAAFPARSHPGGLSPPFRAVNEAPKWTTVNAAPGLAPKRDGPDPRSPPRSTAQPPPHPQPAVPGTRVLRSKSISQQQPPPMPVSLAPAPGPGPAPAQPAVPMNQQRPVLVSYPPQQNPQPAPPQTNGPPPMPLRAPMPMRDAVMHYEKAFSTVVNEQYRIADSFRALQTDIFTVLQDAVGGADRELHAHNERQALLQERENLIASSTHWEGLCKDLQTGNLELQRYREDYETQIEQIRQLQREKDRDQSHIAHLEAKINERNYQLANAQKVLRDSGFDEHGSRCSSVGAGERMSRKELDDWFMLRVAQDEENEKALSDLVDAVESSGVRDMDRKLNMLRSYVTNMSKQRERSKEEWKHIAGNIYPASMSPQSPPRSLPLSRSVEDEPMQDAPSIIREEKEYPRVNGYGKDSKQSSKELTPVSADRTPPPPSQIPQHAENAVEQVA